MSFFLGSKNKISLWQVNRWRGFKEKKESNSQRSLPVKVFSDALNALELAKLLVNCLKSIENQVKELFTFHEEAKESQIKVTESLEFMSAKFDDLEKEIKEKDEKINQLEKAIKNLVRKQKSLSSDIDNLGQYSQQNCLVLHGVNESNNKNTNKILRKTFSEEVGVEIKEDGLDRSHRLGKPKRKDNEPWPIIVRFACYAVRIEIFMNKRKLKGKWLLITESLTSSLMQLLGEAQKKYGVRNVWTCHDGCVMVKENNKVFKAKLWKQQS